MYWETLPNWAWFIYYLFLIVTLGTAIFNVYRRKVVGLSIIAVVLTITVPVISLINSIQRVLGMNEFEHFATQLQQGSFWSIYASFGYTYLLFWWLMCLYKNKMKTEHIG